MADLSPDIEITRAQNRNYALADGFHRMARQGNIWSLLLRYRAQAERHYRHAVEEFDRLKALRAELPNEPILEVQPEENETTSAPPDEPISPPVGRTIVVCGLPGLQERRGRRIPGPLMVVPQVNEAPAWVNALQVASPIRLARPLTRAIRWPNRNGFVTKGDFMFRSKWL